MILMSNFQKSLYATKFENVKEMDIFLDKYHIPKLNQDQVNNLNRPVSREEVFIILKHTESKHFRGMASWNYHEIKEHFKPQKKFAATGLKYKLFQKNRI